MVKDVRIQDYTGPADPLPFVNLPRSGAATDDSEARRNLFRIMYAPGHAQQRFERMWQEYEKLRSALARAEADAAKLRDALENVRLRAAKDRDSPMGYTMLRFCSEAGVTGSPLRNDAARADGGGGK